MLGKRASELYRRGESCSACIFKAYEDVYGMRLPKDYYKICPGINNGFGTGGMCSAAVAAVIVLAYRLRDETMIKQARIYFLTAVNEKLKSTSCGRLKTDCRTAVFECGEILEETIDKFEKE